jgi:hypothetical protein
MTSLGAIFGCGSGFYKGQVSSLGPNLQALIMRNELNVANGLRSNQVHAWFEVWVQIGKHWTCETNWMWQMGSGPTKYMLGLKFGSKSASIEYAKRIKCDKWVQCLCNTMSIGKKKSDSFYCTCTMIHVVKIFLTQ